MLLTKLEFLQVLNIIIFAHTKKHLLMSQVAVYGKYKININFILNANHFYQIVW